MQSYWQSKWSDFRAETWPGCGAFSTETGCRWQNECHIGEAFDFAKAYGSFWRPEWTNGGVESIGMRLLAWTQVILICISAALRTGLGEGRCWNKPFRRWLQLDRLATPHPAAPLLHGHLQSVDFCLRHNNWSLHSNRCAIAMTSSAMRHQHFSGRRSDSLSLPSHTHTRARGNVTHAPLLFPSLLQVIKSVLCSVVLCAHVAEGFVVSPSGAECESCFFPPPPPVLFLLPASNDSTIVFTSDNKGLLYSVLFICIYSILSCGQRIVIKKC